MIKFHKVSYDEFKKAYKRNINSMATDKEIDDIYNNIKLPTRATASSAGYDFYAPFDFHIGANAFHAACDDSIIIPSGISVELDSDKYLMLVPRSGLGFKNGVELLNTVGIIDADYYNSSDNEGHIMFKLNAKRAVDIMSGKAYAQGIINRYYTSNDDNADGVRKGGMGSTGI